MFVKLIIESIRKWFGIGGIYYVCIVVYVVRDNMLLEIFSKINFFIGWILVIFDFIEKLELFLLYLYKEKVFDVLEKKFKFGELIDEELDWVLVRF